jgi:hypothetical protein
VDPEHVCGDGGGLELDRFGFVEVDQFESVTFHPNGAVDLYHLNPRFNQILRVENANSYEYRAVEARLRRRLHRNWQMEAAYTYSTAKGEAESFVDFEGNDPAVSDKASGYLDYDQRHIFKLQAVTHLRSGFLLGGTILWESGLPYSIVENLEDHDDASNITPQRIVPVTGRKNDQRNLSRVTLNAHLEKRLNARAAELTGFLDIENLLDSDDLRLREVDLSGQDAITGERRYGRRFQIGLGVIF